MQFKDNSKYKKIDLYLSIHLFIFLYIAAGRLEEPLSEYAQDYKPTIPEINIHIDVQMLSQQMLSIN